MKKRSFLKSDEQIKTFAAVCIVLGIVFLGISMQFDHIIGGNAVRGYHKEDVYMVYDKEDKAYTQVSKPVWYANYVCTCVTMVFAGALSFFCSYLFRRYVPLGIL